MYVSPNFKTKKELKEAIADGIRVTIFQPGGLFPVTLNSKQECSIEGPHYPKPHTWYAVVKVMGERVVKVVS